MKSPMQQAREAWRQKSASVVATIDAGTDDHFAAHMWNAAIEAAAEASKQIAVQQRERWLKDMGLSVSSALRCSDGEDANRAADAILLLKDTP